LAWLRPEIEIETDVKDAKKEQCNKTRAQYQTEAVNDIGCMLIDVSLHAKCDLLG